MTISHAVGVSIAPMRRITIVFPHSDCGSFFLALTRGSLHSGENLARPLEMQFLYQTFDDALLDSRYYRYAQYRLSYFLVFNFLMVLIDGTEFWLLHKQIPLRIIGEVISLRLLASFLGRGWWGGLELLREGVRAKFSFGNKYGASVLIANWLILSIAIAFLFSGVAWWRLAHLSPFDTTDKALLHWYIGSFFLIAAGYRHALFIH